jgi:hypothetical protein
MPQGGNDVEAAPSSDPRISGFSVGSTKSWEVQLNDAFKKAQDINITGSGPKPKQRVFTQICHTKPSSSCTYIGATKAEHL